MVETEEKFQIEYIYPPNPFTSRGYNTHISCSPIKNKIVYCSANVVILRNADDLTKCEVFSEHKYETTVARFSPSGAYVCSADIKGTVIIWETEWKHAIKKLYEYVLSGAIKDISWTGDNQRIAVAGEGKMNFGKVFLLDTGSSVGEISQVSKKLNAVDMRPVKPYKLAAGGEEAIVTFYEGPPFKYKKTNKTHTGFVNGLRFSPTGNFFVSVSHDKTIILYDALTGDEIRVMDHPGSNHEGAINFCDWFEDGNFFVTASNDKTVKVWHADGNKCVQTLRTAKEPSIDDFQVSVGIIKNTIYSVSLSGAINAWKYSSTMDDGELPFVSQNGHQSNIKQLVYNSLNHILISGDGVGRILLWKNQIPHLPFGKQHTKNILKLAESCDKKFVYSISQDGFLKVLDINEMKFVKEVEMKKKAPVDLIADKISPLVCYVVFEDNEIDKFEDLELKQEINVAFTPSSGDINSKSTVFAIGDIDGFVHLLNAANGESLGKLQNFSSKVTCVKFSSDDKLLAVGDTGYKLKLWDMEKKESLTDKMVYHTASITSITFSPSNRFMLTTSMDNGYYIWSTETFERVVEAKNLHKSGVNVGTFDESGKVITGGSDSLIKVTRLLGIEIV